MNYTANTPAEQAKYQMLSDYNRRAYEMGGENQMAQAIAQIVQMSQQDPQGASKMALDFVMMLAQQMQGAPQEAQAPAQEQAETPVFKKGGIMAKKKKEAKSYMKGMKIDASKAKYKK